jgi:hypothetical protein
MVTLIVILPSFNKAVISSQEKQKKKQCVLLEDNSVDRPTSPNKGSLPSPAWPWMAQDQRTQAEADGCDRPSPYGIYASLQLGLEFVD